MKRRKRTAPPKERKPITERDDAGLARFLKGTMGQSRPDGQRQRFGVVIFEANRQARAFAA
jgi:hypothetical protein